MSIGGEGELPIHGKAKVLIIDDNRDITDSIKLGLESGGFLTVETYNDPMKAVSNFKNGVYILVILDIAMLGMDGFHVYQELRRIDKSVKITFLTALDYYESEVQQDAALEVRTSKFLKKPVTTRDLVDEINELLTVTQPLPRDGQHSQSHKEQGLQHGK